MTQHTSQEGTTQRREKPTTTAVTMTLIYALVSVGKNVLAEYTATSGKFKERERERDSEKFEVNLMVLPLVSRKREHGVYRSD